ncbi:NAD(P)-dependent oxidoreductase [Cupriavidus sp. SW-Y-13]|uniref:NAD(P)-dependent oxidoreductase n=1 Tax=Cupriavidus sp. SW-Y-13 TaxID=2653854 RepID=UPI0013658802|nr:NAD(P)-dependent oxidoreductase [Cupriavidus sp. SW-Y-13]MWL87636.1 NAD(P)H-binding protein [Cupriavidus sp. SW-Y-13]
MKIAIIGATGNVGTRLTDEALRRGHTVTALARQASKLPTRDGVVAKDIDVSNAQVLADALRGSDVVISTVRFLQATASQITDAVKAAGVKRLLVVGGAGSLYIAPGKQLVDTPEFPDAYKAEASAGRDFLNALKKETSLEWTFLSPSALFTPGERTGKFRLGKEDLLATADGSSISMEDYAMAMLDEIEQPEHVRERFTVGY